MDTVPIQDNLAALGYGAVLATRRILGQQLDLLIVRLDNGDHGSVDLFIALTDGMIAAIESLPWATASTDIRAQMLMFLRQHREFVLGALDTDAAARTQARAEIHEADGILLAACDRFGRRLGLFE